MSKSSISERITRNWDRLSGLPGGRLLFSWLAGKLVPYSGSIGATVEELKPGYARLTLKDRRRVRNHLGSFHAIALANLGELTSGLAVMAGMPPKTRGILKQLEASYEKKARGLLTCTSTSAIVSPTENVEHTVEAEIRDQDGDVVSVVKALWVLGPEKPQSPSHSA